MPDVDQDLSAIVDLMLEYRAQLPDGLYPDPDVDFTFSSLRQWYDENYLLYVLEWNDSEAKGCLVGNVGDCYWSPGRRIATDMIFYVRPRYRGSTGIRLLRRFERACRSAGVASIEMNNVSPEHQAMVDRLYRRLGYRLTCITYEKELA